VAQTAFDLSANQAAAVLSLLDRAQVPPLPVFYKLLFDYVAGVKGLVPGRIDSILNDGGGDVEKRLYSEFVAPYENNEPIERAVDQMVARLVTLDKLIVKSVEATTENSRSLSAAGQHLAADKINPVLLGEWILRLKVNNERMRRANEELVAELVVAHRELIETQDEISRLAKTSLQDALTGIANRSGIDEVMSRLLARGQDHALCVAVLDIDRFKYLNDSYGHQAGDRVLGVVTRALLSSARPGDVVGRLGGDEFVVVLPETGLGVAHDIAETFRLAIAGSNLEHVMSEAVLGGLTVSLGVAELQAGETVTSLFERADRCLYRAKQNGRNRVEIVDSD
jgi:diguanylate cyclase